MQQFFSKAKKIQKQQIENIHKKQTQEHLKTDKHNKKRKEKNLKIFSKKHRKKKKK